MVEMQTNTGQIIEEKEQLISKLEEEGVSIFEELNTYNNHPSNIRFKYIHINQLPEPYKSKMEYLKKLKYNTPLTNKQQRNVNNELEQLQKEVNNNKAINNELIKLQENYERREKQKRLRRSRNAATKRVLNRKSKR